LNPFSGSKNSSRPTNASYAVQNIAIEIPEVNKLQMKFTKKKIDLLSSSFATDSDIDLYAKAQERQLLKPV